MLRHSLHPLPGFLVRCTAIFLLGTGLARAEMAIVLNSNDDDISLIDTAIYVSVMKILQAVAILPCCCRCGTFYSAPRVEHGYLPIGIRYQLTGKNYGAGFLDQQIKALARLKQHAPSPAPRDPV